MLVPACGLSPSQAMVRAVGRRLDVTQGPVAGQADGQYSEQTLRSLAVIDEALVNYDLLELLICHVVSDKDRLLSRQQVEQPVRAMPCWQYFSSPSSSSSGEGCLQGEVPETGPARAILVFLPGAPEISRLVRTLQQSAALRQVAQGSKLQVLPLHGSLPAAEQV